LCLFFNAIEQKVIDEEKLLDLERRHFETLCLVEATFPPSFFDLMMHLTAHLAREIWFYGPSYHHQMFPYERFYGFLKSLVYNRLLLEGGIVRGYKTIEAVEWVLMVQNRAQVHRKPTGDLVPFSPRRVLPRFVNPRIRSKLLGFSI
jgi:hypothetical protein